MSQQIQLPQVLSRLVEVAKNVGLKVDVRHIPQHRVSEGCEVVEHFEIVIEGRHRVHIYSDGVAFVLGNVEIELCCFNFIDLDLDTLRGKLLFYKTFMSASFRKDMLNQLSITIETTKSLLRYVPKTNMLYIRLGPIKR